MSNFLGLSYTWDEKAGRYRGSNGRFVPSSQIREACLDVAKASQDHIATLAGSLRSGDITLAEWQSGMMQEIKILHTAEAAAARGGWAQMSQSDWGWVGSEIKKQYQYLENFAIQIEKGLPLDGRFQQRAMMYGRAGYGTYEQMRRRWQQNDNAMEEERRTTTAGESCPGCIEQAKKGWQPIGTLDPIGAEECRTNCKCYFSYRRKEADGTYTVVDD